MDPSKIIIIEDDHDIRELVQEFLESEGYGVNAFRNGLEAMEYLKSAPKPKVILVDWRMPKMSGREFIEAYRSAPENTATPVYIFSAENDSQLGRQIGSTGIVKKPIDFSALLLMLENLPN